MIGLLGEYVARLRATCAGYDSARTWATLAALLGTLGSYGVMALAWLPVSYGGPLDLRYAIPGFTGFVGVVVLAYTLFRRRAVSRDEIEVSSASLRRLVRMASQIHEYGSLSFGQRLALDLRLAEAEVVLQNASRYVQARPAVSSSPWAEPGEPSSRGPREPRP